MIIDSSEKEVNLQNIRGKEKLKFRLDYGNVMLNLSIY